MTTSKKQNESKHTYLYAYIPIYLYPVGPVNPVKKIILRNEANIDANAVKKKNLRIYNFADRGFVGFAAGVDSVLGDGLADEHFGAVDDAAACGGGFFEEACFAWGVDGVEGGHVGFEPFCRQGRGVHIGGHADTGAVDDDIGVEGGQRLEACTAAAVFFGQVSGLAFGTVIDGHFRAGIDQPGHDRPRDTAGPDDGGLFAVELVAFDAESIGQGAHRPDVVGVIGGNDSITSDFERIGGPDGHGQRLDVVALIAGVVDRVGLVGDGDAEAGEVQPRPAEHVVQECVQPLAFILHPEGQIQGVEVVFGKACVIDSRTERVADRVADDAENFGAGVDAVPAEGLFEFADGPLAGRGGLLVVECGEGQEGAELFGEYRLTAPAGPIAKVMVSASLSLSRSKAAKQSLMCLAV